MIPTPNTNHLKRLEFESVYDPAEDTFLLLDALELDQTKFRSKTRLVLEIGSVLASTSAIEHDWLLIRMLAMTGQVQAACRRSSLPF